MKQESGVYAIHNLKTGKRYIGSSSNLQGRFAVHKTTLKNGYHSNKFLQEDYIEFGLDAFKFIVLENCPKDKLFIIEQRYLDSYKRYNMNQYLYNIATDASSPKGIKRSNETKKKMSISTRHKKLNNTSGFNGIYLNKPLSKWVSRIYINKKMKHIGVFTEIKDAVTARNKYIINNNLPDKIQEI